MSADEFKRQLAALISADVVGYSRLMADDEIATIRALTSCRQSVGQLIEENGGHLVDFVGDNMLARFHNTYDAVQSALRIQSRLAELNRDLPEHRQLKFRIGIHLGDIMIDRDSVYGDGVNIAARLEPLAEPGGICVSDMVYRQVHGKLDLAFVDMGEQQLKHISDPVRTYQIITDNTQSKRTAETKAPPAARPALPLPAKPSLAVLPFVNLSMDQQEDHFSDGLTIDLIAALIKIPGLFLVSESSVFSLKSNTMPVAEVGRRLGVRHVLEGGVRRAGSRLRITARLTDTETGRQVWAQRFDRQLGDIFDVQDEITYEIVTAMEVELVTGEPARFIRKAVKNPQTIETYYRGWSALFSSAAADIRFSQQMFEEMIRLEPDASLGYAVGAWAYWWGISQNASLDKTRDLRRSRELAQTAMDMADGTGLAELVMAHIHLADNAYEKALTAAEQAMLARPSCDTSFAVKASILDFLGRPEEAVPLALYAMRLSPVYPSYYPAVLGYAYYHSGKYKEAREAAEVSLKADPTNLEAMILSVVTLVALGIGDQARKTARQIRDTYPDFSPAAFAVHHPYRDRKHTAQILAHLQQAGLSST